MSKKIKTTMVRIGQIEVGTELGAGGIRWPVTAVAVTCQKTGFEQIVDTPYQAMAVAIDYAHKIGGYVYRAALPDSYAALSGLPRS